MKCVPPSRSTLFQWTEPHIHDYMSNTDELSRLKKRCHEVRMIEVDLEQLWVKWEMNVITIVYTTVYVHILKASLKICVKNVSLRSF